MKTEVEQLREELTEEKRKNDLMEAQVQVMLKTINRLNYEIETYSRRD